MYTWPRFSATVVYNRFFASAQYIIYVHTSAWRRSTAVSATARAYCVVDVRPFRRIRVFKISRFFRYFSRRTCRSPEKRSRNRDSVIMYFVSFFVRNDADGRAILNDVSQQILKIVYERFHIILERFRNRVHEFERGDLERTIVNYDMVISYGRKRFSFKTRFPFIQFIVIFFLRTKYVYFLNYERFE